MIIDFHTHIWPEKVSQKAKENLESLFKIKMASDPTIDNLLRFMDKNGVNQSIVCAVATRPSQVYAINEWMFKIRSSRLKAFCALHQDYENWKEEIKRIKDNGDGIKFQPEFQNFYVDDEKMFPFYEEIQRLNLPVIFHCGEELSGTMLVRSSPNRIVKVKEKFPELKIIAAHFGGFRLWDEVEKYLLGKDIFLDTSYFFSYVPKERVKKMILGHRPDRLLFGTDFPLIDQKDDIDYLNKLEIPAELKDRIFSRNAIELLGIK
jgi:predicted TIM-barrel fold metal-dependent hydrolase